MPQKPILDLLDCYRHRNEVRGATLEELRRLLAEEPAVLGEDDLLAIREAAASSEADLLASEGEMDLWVAAGNLLDAIREELLRREWVLQETVFTSTPDISRVVGSVLGQDGDEGAATGRRSRMWWLASQPLGDCTVPQLAGLASLPGGDPESGGVIARAGAELVQRGYRPPPREDDAGERYSYWGREVGEAGPIRISDRRVIVGGQVIRAADLAGFQVRGLWAISWRGLCDCVLLFGLLPLYIPYLLFLIWAAWRRWEIPPEPPKDLIWVGWLGFVVPTLFLGAPLWLAVGYPVLWPILGCLRSYFSAELEPNPFPRRAYLTLRTHSGEVRVVTLVGERVDLIRDSLTRLLAETRLPPVPEQTEVLGSANS